MVIRIIKKAVLLSLLLSSGLALAGRTNLLNKDLSASIAKSHKSLGEGKHEFVIDSTKMLPGKKKVTYDFLKKSIEQKLGPLFSAKVEGDDSKIIVTYEGSESSFLKAITKTKIRSSFKTSLAQNQSGSDTGIRAQKGALKDPAGNEVLGKVVSLSKDHMTVVVLKIGGKGLTNKVKKKPTKIFPVDGKFKVGDAIYFVPVKMSQGKWETKGLRKP